MSFCIRLNYFHKFKGHFFILQAIINSYKQLFDVFVGLPWSVNDLHTFKQSLLYQKNLVWWFIQFASGTTTWKQCSIIYVFQSFKTWFLKAIFEFFLNQKNDESKVYMVFLKSIQCYIIFSMIGFNSHIIEICVTSHTNILFTWESFIYTSRKALNSWTWFCKSHSNDFNNTIDGL
jgi:hypothetical protein